MSSSMDASLARSPTHQEISLLSAFGSVSAMVLFGLAVSWFLMSDQRSVLKLSLPEPITLSKAAPTNLSAEVSQDWLARGDVAFASGQIVTPADENALDYYQLALRQAPDSAAAAEGIARVVSYLLSRAESAVFRNDWAAARADAELVLETVPSDGEARKLLTRVERLERVEQLTQLAATQLLNNRLTKPRGNNALATYRKIIEIDNANEVAIQGQQMIAQRLLANAQSAAFAGNGIAATEFLEQVREIDPALAGIGETEKIASQRQKLVKDRSIQALLAAASMALQRGDLITPEGKSAMDLFEQVLVEDPKSEAAIRGKALVSDGLIDRGRNLIASQEFDQAEVSLTQAESAGANSATVDGLRAELAFQRRLADARNGQFDAVYSISSLKIVRQTTPDYPRKAKGDGWVSLEFTVSETGAVVDAEVLELSDQIFARPALAAIDRWRFAPHKEGGRAVPVRAQLRFRFEGE